MSDPDWIILGSVLRVHGVRGDLVIGTSSDRDSLLASVKEVYFTNQSDGPFLVKEAAWMPRGWKVSLHNFTLEMAKARIGQTLLADRSCLTRDSDSGHLIEDLVGAVCVDAETQQPIGPITGVEPGLQDRWWIEFQGAAVAIPAVRFYIEKIDTDDRGKVTRVVLRNWRNLL